MEISARRSQIQKSTPTSKRTLPCSGPHFAPVLTFRFLTDSTGLDKSQPLITKEGHNRYCANWTYGWKRKKVIITTSGSPPPPALLIYIFERASGIYIYMDILIYMPRKCIYQALCTAVCFVYLFFSFSAVVSFSL